VEKLSPGQRQLVEIAKCLKSEPDIIIFDEPTTSLTANETKKLFEIINRLKYEGKSIIYISHILNDVKKLTDKIVVLRDGQVTNTGNTESFDIHNMIKSMVGRDLTQLYPARKSKANDEVVLKVDNISEPGVVHKISFELHKGEILGLFGLMGSGRSELLRILFGLDEASQGSVSVKDNLIKKPSPRKSIENCIGFVTEDRKGEGLLLNFNIEENLSLVALPQFSSKTIRIINAKKKAGPILEYIDKLKIKTGDITQQNAKSLSGGNQQKIVIAKWLIANPEILFVDEPTRGIDVGAKFEVYSILNDLAAEGKSILMVSSEFEELMGMCDRILVMNQGELVSEFGRDEFDSQKLLSSAFRQYN
jgi:ABC-type sugar transport system ATPase subunit